MKINKLANSAAFSLLLFSALLLCGVYYAWQMWPSMVISSLKWQREINGQLSDLLYLAKDNLFKAGFTLTGLSFIYGLLHSLGPGHGKIIVTTYLATHPAKVKTSLWLSTLAALMQAVVAILLVSSLLLIFNSSMREVNNKAELFISFSFLSIILLASFIILRTLKQLHSLYSSQSKTKKNSAAKIPDNCTHKHFATASEIEQASSFREYIAIILSIGIRPCTGAIMILLFANMLDLYWLGIISAFVMALGTAITVSCIAVLTLSGKKLIRYYLRDKVYSQRLPLLKILSQLTAGCFLLLLGLLLFNSQTVMLSPVL